MELLQELHQQGFKVILVDDEHIGIIPKDKITPELAEKIKAHKPLLIETLRKHTEADQYHNKAQGNIVNSEASQEARRYCRGYQPPRYVHPDVCKWHIREADVHCLNCKYLNVEDKKTLMDAYLDKAIARLNKYYRSYHRINWDKPGARKEIDRLEKAITEAFLQGEAQGYVEAVDRWEIIFKELRIK